ncbi:hypothetical protein [Diaphorobacter sp. MNS-0]|uniref:hypothetical protein n=1 Tax=unclassified Diaphorobacter TaxID=2649760 RepID=UPI001C734D3A|nr:hypothetical protein [Diaphorobacter sp. MNS-0]QYY27077.1 hypothetical protein K2L43_08145 [Diaphorobacter sp. MNS-0]UOB04287.1 hypothetical protein MRB47_12660 [Diaphorobacter sp. LI3]
MDDELIINANSSHLQSLTPLPCKKPLPSALQAKKTGMRMPVFVRLALAESLAGQII